MDDITQRATTKSVQTYAARRIHTARSPTDPHEAARRTMPEVKPWNAPNTCFKHHRARRPTHTHTQLICCQLADATRCNTCARASHRPPRQPQRPGTRRWESCRTTTAKNICYKMSTRHQCYLVAMFSTSPMQAAWSHTHTTNQIIHSMWGA